MKTGPPHSTTGSKTPATTGHRSILKDFLTSVFVLLRNFLSDWLDAVVGRQPLLEWLGKLLRELGPALLSNLVLETVQDFSKHILQVRLGMRICCEHENEISLFSQYHQTTRI